MRRSPNTLRVELRHHGVGVGCAYYSWIDTDVVRGGEKHKAGRRAIADALAMALSLL